MGGVKRGRSQLSPVEDLYVCKGVYYNKLVVSLFLCISYTVSFFAISRECGVGEQGSVTKDVCYWGEVFL